MIHASVLIVSLMDCMVESLRSPTPLRMSRVPGSRERDTGTGTLVHKDRAGQIVVLNGAPRSGKSSIAGAIQQTFDGLWMNLGADWFKRMTPVRYQPGIGLRPGGERPDLEPLVVVLYGTMYDAIAAHSRQGLNVVVDVGHHDSYSVPRGILYDSARRLAGLPVLFVGVRCPLEVIMERRRRTWGVDTSDVDAVPLPVRRWQEAVHEPGIYDLEIDTSQLSPEACAEIIQERLGGGHPGSAFTYLAKMDGAAGGAS